MLQSKGSGMLEIANKYVFSVFLICFFVLISCNNRNDSINYLPKKLGGLSLSKVIENEEATKIINKMHGKTLAASDNYIAHYGSSSSRNSLYVSFYENDEKAKTELMSMAKKMAKGTKVFAPLTFDKMGDSVHFQTEGMGHKHYFYRIDNMLIWWQVEPDKAQATYNDLLNFDFAALKQRSMKK
ncbi:MAG: hypothetical protein H8D96_21270 [Desulfobacterales bacterium]|uniref:Lipoprotein n=1 Tax=Candidatus Desulfatibia vada TaxID=2841696 RepID=A0A8J6P677_9BACT|nr:hypothetical protein [Candidatus Desulfatibia vada]